MNRHSAERYSIDPTIDYSCRMTRVTARRVRIIHVYIYIRSCDCTMHVCIHVLQERSLATHAPRPLAARRSLPRAPRVLPSFFPPASVLPLGVVVPRVSVGRFSRCHAAHARVSTGFLPRPRTTIAVPRADAKRSCHFSATFSPLVTVSLLSMGGEPRRAHARVLTHHPPREEYIVRFLSSFPFPPLRPPSTMRRVVVVSRDHLAAGLTRMATRRDRLVIRATVTYHVASASAFFSGLSTTVVGSSSVVETARATHRSTPRALSRRYIDSDSRAPRFALFRG